MKFSIAAIIFSAALSLVQAGPFKFSCVDDCSPGKPICPGGCPTGEYCYVVPQTCLTCAFAYCHPSLNSGVGTGPMTVTAEEVNDAAQNATQSVSSRAVLEQQLVALVNAHLDAVAAQQLPTATVNQATESSAVSAAEGNQALLSEVGLPTSIPNLSA